MSKPGRGMLRSNVFRRRPTVLQNPSGVAIRNFFAELAGTSDDERAERFIADAEAYAFAWYEKSGLPTEAGIYRRAASGGWNRNSADDPIGTWHWALGKTLGDDTVLAFAGDILFQAHTLRLAMRDRPAAASIVVRTVQLHQLLVTTDLEYGMRRALGRGLKSLMGSSAGGRAKHATEVQETRAAHARWQAEADQYWARHPRASKSEVAQHVGKVLGVSYNTVRQEIKKT